MLFWGAFFALLVTNGLCDPAEKMRDFKYRMTAGRSYTRQISYQGPTLIVGSFPEVTLKDTDSDTVMECEMSARRNDYRDIYRTRAYFRNESDTSKALNSTMLAEYFVISRKELWSCSSSETVGLLRVVNELIGSKEIFKVIFPDGVKVFPKSLTPDKKTAILREIKYLDLYGVPVRYEGWFKIKPKEIIVEKDFFIPDLRQTLKQSERSKQGDGFKEIQYKTGPDKFESITSADSSLTVGEANAATGIQSSVLNCKKYQGANPFPFNLRPKCEVIIKKQQINITKDNYFQYFTPIRDEFWVCEGQNKLQVLRLVNEFVTRFEVGRATVYSEVIELRKIALWRKYGMRVKTVRYFNYPSYDKPITRYQGIIKLIGSEDTELQVLPNYAEQTGSEIKEFDYYLHSKCVFKAMVSSRGINIKLGMHYTKQIGSESDKVSCTLQPSGPYMHDYGTKFRLSLRMGDKHFLKAIPRSKHADYWDFVKQEVWYCESTSSEDHKFLRIVNELRGFVEFFEVEYHDGIQLYVRALSGDSKSVNVIEIKYIDPISFEPLMYPGKLKLQSRPASTMHEFIKCFNCDGQPIGRTENDIYFGVNARKDKFAVENRQRGVLYDLEQGLVWQVAGTGTATLFVGAPPTKTIGDIIDVIECVPNKASYDAFPTLIRELKMAWGRISFITYTSEHFRAANIKILKTEVWLCRNSELKFYRVKNTVTFEKEFKELLYYDGTTVTLTEKPGGSVVQYVEEIKYIDFDDYSYVKYEGDVIIYPPLEGVDVISGTVVMGKEYALSTVSKEHSDGQEVIYLLDYERVHKFDILREYELVKNTKKRREKRTIISIGRSIENKVDRDNTASKSVECLRRHPLNENVFRADYLPFVRIRSERDPTAATDNNQETADQSTLFDRFFHLINYQVWDCQTEDGRYSFQRVVSKFSYFLEDDKLDEVWYYDGFTVESGTANRKETFHFLEIKYIKDSSTIKYDGLIFLEDDYGEHHFDTTEARESTLMSQAVLDINYELPPTFVYKTVIGTKGAILKMGSRYEEHFDFGAAFGDNNMLTCSRTYYEPRGINTDMPVEIGTQDQSLFKYTKITEEVKSSLFKFTVKDFWNCRFKNGNHELIRVVNSWESNEGAISEVIHFDGVTVPLDGSIIEEVKFMTKKGKVVRYDGFVVFENEEANRLLPTMGEREFTYDLHSDLIHFRSLNPEVGPVVEVGSRWNKVYKSSAEVRCYISQNAKITFKEEYKLRVLTTKKQSQNEYIKSEMSMQELKDKFRVVRNEAYECKLIGSSQEVAFIKVVNKLETKMNISAVFHTDGITIWKSPTTLGAYYIREVKFIDSKDPNIVLKYEGKVKNKFEKKSDRFDEGSSVEEERAPPDGAEEDQKQVWYMAYQKWMRTNQVGNEPLEDIHYSPGIKSRLVQQSRGYNIKVGSGWQKEMGDRRDTFVCVKDTNKYVALQLLPKVIVYEDYDEYILDEDTINDFFKTVSQEVLKCSKGSQSFIRVRTELVGRWGMRRIYYVDGVRVFSYVLGAGINTARLVELKYLDPNDNYTVVKYEGKLEKVKG